MHICKDLNLDEGKFIESFHSELLKQETMATFSRAQRYAHSYPTLLAEKDGEMFVLEQGYASFENIINRIDQLIY